MSGIAQMLIKDGCTISGSDRSASPLTERLTELGATIYIGHDANNIKDDCDIVVYSAAIGEDNPERQRAHELGILQIDRAEMLGMIMKGYDCPIAISGTHGKTTTTSMVSLCFLEALKDPSIQVGALIKELDGNYRVGNSEYFILESCEYKGNFLKFFPHTEIILNILPSVILSIFIYLLKLTIKIIVIITTIPYSRICLP